VSDLQELREDVKDALVQQGFKPGDVLAAVAGLNATDFDGMFREASQWLSARKGNGAATKTRSVLTTVNNAPLEKLIAVDTLPENPLRRCPGFGLGDRPCGVELGVLNRTGFCSQCYARKHYRDKGRKRPTHGEVAAMTPAGVQPPVRFQLNLTERQLERFFANLPPQIKLDLIAAYLATP